ncbi:MAG: hypothetical protein C5B53_12735 [Candidatus Melainabacteria bacterium]|nr:MAG: hypothetical protein C5B53_12735 [Candidatus Melainabacteria bacterium]
MDIVLPKFLFVPVLALGLSVQYMPSCQAQGLPNTNFGKFVHQPGDNQYEEKAQRERHAPPPQPRIFMPSGGAGGGFAGGAPARPAWVPTPPPQLPDISVQPIVADEPIRTAGFPPLPDRPDLPVATAWARSVSGAANRGGGASDSNDNGGFSRKLQGVHEHYNHYMPGACIKQNPHPSSGDSSSSSSGDNGGGNGGGYSGGGGGGGNAGGTHGYYKCTTPEYYGSNTGNSGGGGSAAKQARPSREPGLDPRRDGLQRPEVPTTVVVNQATTEEINSQDLSLPDDDYNAQNPSTKNGRGSRFGRNLGRSARQVMYRVTTPLIYSGGGMMRMH